MDNKEKIKFSIEKVKVQYIDKIKFNDSNYDKPKKLYKYMPVNDNSISTIKEKYVWCGIAKNMNDPFECVMAINEEKIENLNNILHPDNNKRIDSLADDKLRRLVLSEIKKEERMIEEYCKGWIEKNKQCTFLCSLCEENNNLLLWSHYANEHKGICVEYLVEDIENVTSCLYPVIYSIDMPSIEEMGKNVEVGCIKQLTTKSIDWEYEHEWRIISPNEIEKPNVVTRDGEIVGGKLNIKANKIYLGCKIDIQDKAKIKEVAKSIGVKVIDMKMDSVQYKIIECK